MFNKKKIESLEQSIAALTEDLQKKDNQIESLFLNLQNIIAELNEIKSEKYSLESISSQHKKSIEEISKQSKNADEEHNRQLVLLRESIDSLISKCSELQKENNRIIEEHKIMIDRYEESIKEYKKQADKMRNNVLKKMNMNNVFEVKEG